MLVTSYVSVLQKGAKPIKFNKYLTSSNVVSDLRKLNIVGSAGEHTVEIQTDGDHVEPYWITIVVLYTQLNSSILYCHLSTTNRSCQYEYLENIQQKVSFLRTKISSVSILINILIRNIFINS